MTRRDQAVRAGVLLNVLVGTWVWTVAGTAWDWITLEWLTDD